MSVEAARSYKSRHRLAQAWANHNLIGDGLLRRIVDVDRKYSSCVEAGDGDHAV